MCQRIATLNDIINWAMPMRVPSHLPIANIQWL